jgi:uncharacterized protein
MIQIVLRLALVYILLCGVMFAVQRSLMYHPNRKALGAPASYGLETVQAVRARTADNLDLLAWFAPPEKKDGKVIVFFHGNAGNIADRLMKIRHFVEKGYGIYMCEYRGFAGNPGNPTEEGLYADARAGLHWLNEKGYAPSQLVYYGESIGSGVAVQMAGETPPYALILEAAFSSIVDVASRMYFWIPVRLLMRQNAVVDAARRRRRRDQYFFWPQAVRCRVPSQGICDHQRGSSQ